MRIGFDAKRAFFNTSGLGNYSRSLISNLSKYAYENQYVLFKSKVNKGISFDVKDNVSIVTPTSPIYKKMDSVWRSYGMLTDIKKSNLDIYHGLSHELPIGIAKAGIKTVVTMHDVIFLRYPELFSWSYRYVFNRKYKHACEKSDVIVAVSSQSKSDVMKYYNVPDEKIKVVYQGCNPIYYDKVTQEAKDFVVKKYNLPHQFLLYVGTIEKRKNALGIIEALHAGKIDFPLVIVGRATDYVKELKAYISTHHMQSQVILLHDVKTEELPALYQSAIAFVYPSLFEGFGIPILESLNSGTPVITSKGSCFPEVGGEAAKYVEYGNTEEMISTINTILGSGEVRNTMIVKGHEQALKFREEKLVTDIMKVYTNLL